MTLHVMLEGRTRLAVPYDPQRMSETARALHELLPSIRELGKVAVVVNDDDGISHIIVAR